MANSSKLVAMSDYEQLEMTALIHHRFSRLNDIVQSNLYVLLSAFRPRLVLIFIYFLFISIWSHWAGQERATQSSRPVRHAHRGRKADYAIVRRTLSPAWNESVEM